MHTQMTKFGTPKLLFLEARETRKRARTAIYKAVYGEQNYNPRAGKRPNLPWSDPTRTRPQGWTAAHALPTVTSYWPEAQFDDHRKAIINRDLGLKGADVLK